MGLKINFLGTGTSQGVPVLSCECEVCKSTDVKDKRFRTSLLVEYNDKSIVIDTGPDFRSQMLRAKAKRLDAVLYTHAHKDHTAGLDDIRPFNFKQNIDMPIYAEERVLKTLKTEFSYAFADIKYPGVPRLDIHPIDEQPFILFGKQIVPIRAMHYKLPVLGFRIDDFTYITDANYLSEKSIEKIKGSKVLVLNALRIEEHYSHFNLKEALEVVQKSNVERAYFTHISHLLGTHASVQAKLPSNCYLAYDGQSLDFT